MKFDKKSAEEFEKTFDRRFELATNQYVPNKALPKTRIILHHTAGTTAAGAARWWAQTPERVGTPFIIDRDGTIYRMFDPEAWAYHLGASYWPAEAYCIPIEIVAAGQLVKEDTGDFFFYPLYPQKNGGIKIPSEDVQTMKPPYMGYSYFHKYTDKQVESILKLIAYLMFKYPSIQVQPDFDKSFNVFDKAKLIDNSPGIYTHSVFITYKVDAYPQPNLMKGLKDLLFPKQQGGGNT